MVVIYALSLSNGKYYIGKTQQLEIRLEQHFEGGGSTWTQKHKPKKVLETINGDDGDEDKTTLRYMKRYGIENVRGGSFCRVTLTGSDKKTLEKMLKTISDSCYHCNKEGHFSSQCPNKDSFIPSQKFKGYYKKLESESDSESDIYGDEIEDIWACNYCGKEFSSKKGVTFHENCHCSLAKKSKKKKKSKNCYRCGRLGHYAMDCYAKRGLDGQELESDIYGDEIEDIWACNYCGKEFSSKKGATFHVNRYCQLAKQN